MSTFLVKVTAPNKQFFNVGSLLWELGGLILSADNPLDFHDKT